MEILTRFPISGTCDQCKKAWRVDVPLGSTLLQMIRYVEDSHRDRSPNCPRVKAILSDERSFLDDVTWMALTKTKSTGATPVFRMIWRDADELDLTKEERKTPMIIIGR
jgi:hypothetical protein